MPISKERILSAALEIASVEHVRMDSRYVLEDTMRLADAFPEEEEFTAAVANLTRTLSQLVRNRLTPAALKHQLSGWHSCHFQHRVRQGMPADCRIIYRQQGELIDVLAFGHRRRPTDIYRFASDTRV